MNTPLSWLKDYVPGLDVTDQEYRDGMTLSGTKVENYSRRDKNLEKIIVGEVLDVQQHPDADKLVVCQVNTGSETIQIVTGAPNDKENIGSFGNINNASYAEVIQEQFFAEGYEDSFFYRYFAKK